MTCSLSKYYKLVSNSVAFAIAFALIEVVERTDDMELLDFPDTVLLVSPMSRLVHSLMAETVIQ